MNGRRTALVLLPLLAVFTAALPAQKKAAAERAVRYIRAGHVFDATTEKLRDNVILVVRGERIERIAPGIRTDRARRRRSDQFKFELCVAGTD